MPRGRRVGNVLVLLQLVSIIAFHLQIAQGSEVNSFLTEFLELETTVSIARHVVSLHI